MFSACRPLHGLLPGRGYTLFVQNGNTNAVETLGLQVRTAQSIMRTDVERESLARACLDFVSK